MLADSRLFTDQCYWDACNMEILGYVLDIDILPVFEKHFMLRAAAAWLAWEKADNKYGWKPNSEWKVYCKDKTGIWEFERISTFPELVRKLKGNRHLKVLKEVALYELEQREKEGEDECS